MTEVVRKIHGPEILIAGSPVTIDLQGTGRFVPRVAILGPSGTYGELAAQELLGTQPLYKDLITGIAQHKLIRLADMRSHDSYDLAVVAVENSSEGDVKRMNSSLLAAREAQILGGIVIPVPHSLAVRAEEFEGIPDERVLKLIIAVISHHQGIDQCEKFLDAQLSGVETIETRSTALAAQLVGKGKHPRAAAIIRKEAAEEYGLRVLDYHITDSPRNSTKFYVVGRGVTEPTGDDQTLIAFDLKDNHIGAEHKASGVFVKYLVDRTKVDSHSTGDMDIYGLMYRLTGHQKDPHVAAALEELQEDHCTRLKILGSYKRPVVLTGAEDPGILTMNGNGNH